MLIIKQILFRIGIDLKRLLKNPFPYISLKLTNLFFNLLQTEQLAVI